MSMNKGFIIIINISCFLNIISNVLYFKVLKCNKRKSFRFNVQDLLNLNNNLQYVSLQLFSLKNVQRFSTNV